jgi:hypothetical protein
MWKYGVRSGFGFEAGELEKEGVVSKVWCVGSRAGRYGGIELGLGEMFLIGNMLLCLGLFGW